MSTPSTVLPVAASATANGRPMPPQPTTTISSNARAVTCRADSVVITMAPFSCPGPSPMMNQGYLRHPTLCGDTIAFVTDDDLWSVSAGGGVARRLTAGGGA